MSNAQHLLSGKLAEKQAQVYLEQQGLTCIERNWCCRMGEIDLIMKHSDTLVFVEVRYRSSSAFGGALSSITPKKSQHLIKAAEAYLAQKKLNCPCRFDAVLIQGDQPVQWLKNIIEA